MIVAGAVIAAAAAMFAVERLARGRARPPVRGSRARALALNAVQIAVVWVAGHHWDGWLARNRPWSADGLGVPGGALAGYLAITFVYYCSDLPLWDALFGTLRNPRHWSERCGLGDAEHRLGEMLVGVDVGSAPDGRAR